MDPATARAMPIRDHRDLQCWRLADAVRAEVIAICAKKPLARDFKFCNGFRDAAGSVCHNLAEGFERYESGHIVQFFRYALASLAEVKDYFSECHTRGVINQDQLERLRDRCEHTKATALNFMKPHLPSADRSHRRARRNQR
jgi:four helix bundle protein